MRDKAPIKLTDDARKKALASIRRYADENLELQIGDLKAELMLDYILAEHGPTIYNQAITDAQTFFEERTQDLAAMNYHSEFTYWTSDKRSR
jgi:uncharacterized protein (DUF2164 family)